MKPYIYSVAALIVVVGAILVALSIASRKQPELGLVDGRLQPCPASPNCVCSEYPSNDAYIEPLNYIGPVEEAWRRVKRVIDETGGEVIAEQPDYLHAVYQTPWLRFIDDVELRLNQSQQVIHVRSASRVGRSDFGANRQRVERIRACFASKPD
ncbi:DUF1499 domain-containing protein [Thiohalophilus sp.]|uniref:DUF1499 domain-containing protein n=1 Tax=Thiohalophilus sp. TaxID=3028392 RepID=UPI002ACE4D29|nr:DUF1499 domain-containing protein [Thiohalophilus sp.]MDZ7803642.1 DUF1499 domain-containing protein [Thiohalophilus sp.]